jgi:hypothetical protein
LGCSFQDVETYDAADSSSRLFHIGFTRARPPDDTDVKPVPGFLVVVRSIPQICSIQQIRSIQQRGTTLLMRTKALLASILLAVSVAAALAGAAGPALANDHSAQQAGQVTLFQNPDRTGWTQPISYLGCQSGLAVPSNLPTIGAFDNRPVPGCQVTLHTNLGGSFVLCAGSGVVPVQFRQVAFITITRGVSPPCL